MQKFSAWVYDSPDCLVDHFLSGSGKGKNLYLTKKAPGGLSSRGQSPF